MNALLFLVLFKSGMADTVQLMTDNVYYVNSRFSCLSCQRAFADLFNSNGSNTLNIVNVKYTDELRSAFMVENVVGYHQLFSDDSLWVIAKKSKNDKPIFSYHADADMSYFILVSNKIRIVPLSDLRGRNGALSRRKIAKIAKK